METQTLVSPDTKPQPRPVPERLRYARWDLLLQDYYVAASRFTWAGRRNVADPTRKKRGWHKIKATPDRRAHGDTLRRLILDLHILGVNPQDLGVGPPAADPGAARLARRIATDRLRSDRMADRCLCGHPDCASTLP